ncbi:MAG: hypothetical protein QF473_19780, partial [Planctomycetota bacterium]|nr:hypothetical protein [Planctomycetota bacterium]
MIYSSSLGRSHIVGTISVSSWAMSHVSNAGVDTGLEVTCGRIIGTSHHLEVSARHAFEVAEASEKAHTEGSTQSPISLDTFRPAGTQQFNEIEGHKMT